MKTPRSFVSPLKSLSLIALTLALSVAVQTSALSTWVPATASAPGGNVPTPLNTGLNTQSKLGGLFLNTSNTQPFDIGLSVFGKTVLNGDVQITATGTPATGKVLTALDANGNVGWGTATGGGGVIPSGMIAMFDGVCPQSWTRFSGLDGRVPKGASTFGATGGSNTHTHTWTATITYVDKSWRPVIWSDLTIQPASSWPPYLEVVWCKKD